MNQIVYYGDTVIYNNIHYHTNMYYIYMIVSCSHPCLFIEQVIPKLRYLFTPFDGILGSNACSRDLSLNQLWLKTGES